ncbi:STAS domain-containing protein [Streptomonospora nanhaiensis]|uniref:Anti-sigma factor antagonist n=1 Tax=Streptomonospora nanhaiensis TaxID=1323731 RepID=A0A853BR62_9ACTN|nr:STAS domain-containing protein [Streptomonospora nanhaiensis]MBV2364047.1 STAS domain-containing protein [Streptomonospora nanhaiensis]MBX9388669.1 STAS domain-containing protein [Streptomonospora nanhaiensis]NYI97047.1 anti-sigma B factor antagonist [Streptomonospora nanhaiensis]
MVTAFATSLHSRSRPVVAAMPAEIDVYNRAELLNRLTALLETAPGTLIVDMTDTVFCDSAAVHVLVDAQRAAHAAGRRIRVAAPNRAVRRVLEICQIDRLMPVYRSLHEAAPPRPTAG